MSTAPYAKIRASLNGGALQTGGITASGGETVQLTADPAGLAGATQYLWRILNFHPDFAQPSGWSTDSDGNYYSTSQTPTSFTLLNATDFDKYVFELKLNGGGPALTGKETAAQRQAILNLTDRSTAIRVNHATGIEQVAFYEETQFSPKGWIAAIRVALRLIAAFISGGGGGGGGVTDHGALSGLNDQADHPYAVTLDGTRAFTGDQSMGSHKLTNLATPTASTDAANKAYVDSAAGFSPAGTPAAGQVVKWDGSEPVWANATAYAITGFAASVPVLEVGATATNPAFTASHSATPVSLLLTNSDDGESKDVHTTPNGFASSHAFTKTVNNASVTFTITGSDGVSGANRSASLFWRPRVYWGTGAAGGNSEAFIEALAGSALQASRAGTFTVNATGSLKIYWAAPASYGTPTFTVGGFAGGFNLNTSAVTVTNAFGIAQNYQVWESSTAGLGNTTVTVS